ncbi:urease accessory protein F-like [Phragmites australis]|uniref:urease accessory protein F-like n=1 Tax=Phragmites australis TaxID=29695 RepID=UPI002D769E65|nr:urease accessory protein F-like [Phragmites australis]XP_062223996.1 urease accessory protein F-like [Phragmites australis]
MESDYPVSKKTRLDDAMDSEMEEVPSSASGVNPNLHWTQWQILDSILPTGGFAHSYGLEATMQSRIVNNQEDLRSFVIQVMENTGSLLLPFVYCASKSPDAATWVKLDQLLEATLTNEVGRKASTSQGSALLRVAASVFTEIQALQDLRQAFLGSKTVSFHHAPIFGLICGLVGFDGETAQRAYMFVTMRDVISAATRLNLIGPLAASVLQHQIAPDAERMVQKWRDRDVADASQTAPLLDALQGCHAYMFSRLFCS